MKKVTKLVAVLSAAALLVGSFAGCSNKRTRTEHDGTSFTYWTKMDGASTRAKLESYNDMMMYQELEKMTGVHIDFQHPTVGSTGNEAFLTMLNNPVKPELVEYNWSSYPGGPQAAIDEGVIIALNDYLEDYAPNYYACMNGTGVFQNDAWKNAVTTSEGKYYGFNNLAIGNIRGFAGIFIRSDLLKKWGLSIPKTIDDWDKVFAKAKAEGIAEPFTTNAAALSFSGANTFNTAWDVGKYTYLEGDKVVFAPFQPGYKEYVAKMAEWYSKGYFNTDFVTAESDKINNNMVTGKAIATYGYIGGGIGKILPAGREEIEGFDLAACPYPAKVDGSGLSEFQNQQSEASNTAIAIMWECGNYEKAAQWCDTFYSEDGYKLQIFGVEGDTYTVEDVTNEDGTVTKKFKYTDKITKDYLANGFNSVEEALYYYMLPCNHPGFQQHPDYLDGFYPEQLQKDALSAWNESIDESRKHTLPTLSYTIEQQEEIGELSVLADDPLNKGLFEIIMGTRPIDDYESIIAEASEYERIVEIKQEAYDAYMNKVVE